MLGGQRQQAPEFWIVGILLPTPSHVRLASQLAADAGGSGMILLTMTEVSNDVADKIRNDDARITAEVPVA